jgi:hypothetical protein
MMWSMTRQRRRHDLWSRSRLGSFGSIDGWKIVTLNNIDHGVIGCKGVTVAHRLS